VTLVGRPNAGKSTLMNRFVGQRLSIVTPKAQTTWQRVTGLLSTEGTQLVFLDTPGLLEARDLLQRSMLAAALEAVQEADVVLIVADATRPPGAEDLERLSTALAGAAAPRRLAINKIDAASPEAVGAWRRWAVEAGGIDGVHEISATTGEGTDALLEALADDLPEAPFLYPEDEVSSAPVRFFVAELVRETIFDLYGDEIPYGAFCQVEEFRENEDPIYIHVNIFVERSSQKGILIGSGGGAIRELGIRARSKVEHFLDARVYLDLWVKPLKAWRRKRSHLGQLGFRVPQQEV
jgi:GTP-binding protein Era